MIGKMGPLNMELSLMKWMNSVPRLEKLKGDGEVLICGKLRKSMKLRNIYVKSTLMMIKPQKGLEMEEKRCPMKSHNKLYSQVSSKYRNIQYSTIVQYRQQNFTSKSSCSLELEANMLEFGY